MPKQQKAFADFHVWDAPESRLLDAVVSNSIVVRLSFAGRHQQDGQTVEGTFASVDGNTASFCIREAGALDVAPEAGGVREASPCQVAFRIDYGVLPDDSIRPGEYRTNGEVVAVRQDDSGNTARLDVRLGHRYTMRKIRRCNRVVWRPAADSLVRLLAARPAPANGEELQYVLYEAMRMQDKSEDLLDISGGGALISEQRDIVSQPLMLHEYHLLLFSAHKKDAHALPFVFLAKKAGSLPADSTQPDRQGLRLHFLKELDWNASTKGELVWRDIGENGSNDLRLLLQHSDSYFEDGEESTAAEASGGDNGGQSAE